MNIFHAIILGIVEGITEFLPISSTGHMILTSKVLGIQETDFLKTFEIVIQLGAILAVVALYFKRLITSMDTIKKVIVAFIPTAIIGLIFHDLVKAYLLGSTLVVSISLIVGGIIIIWFEKTNQKKQLSQAQTAVGGEVGKSLNIDISYMQSIKIGFYQSIAMIPGVSRSAATIIGGQISGLSRIAIVEFSFLLAIPTMFAASFLDLYKGVGHIGSNEVMLLVVGFVTAFIVAFIAIKSFINYIQKHSFIGFAVYRIIVGVLFLILLAFSVL
jgi:undecaprenyl-diphosphatase